MLSFFKLNEAVKLKSQEEQDIKDILKKLPKSHAKLISGFELTLEPNNGLKGDKKHVGFIHKKKIHVAAPWNFSRCHVFCHEVAHMVWQELMTPELKKEWKSVCKKMNVPKDIETDPEELFAHAYACHYCTHKAHTYFHKVSDDFIKQKIPH